MTQGQRICNTIYFKCQLYLVLRENSVLTSISEIPCWRPDLKRSCIYITKSKIWPLVHHEISLWCILSLLGTFAPAKTQTCCLTNSLSGIFTFYFYVRHWTLGFSPGTAVTAAGQVSRVLALRWHLCPASPLFCSPAHAGPMLTVAREQRKRRIPVLLLTFRADTTLGSGLGRWGTLPLPLWSWIWG